MKSVEYIIYRHTNKINGKIYIGQTKVGIEKRWYYHCKQASDPNSASYKTYFAQAIRKYGKNNFDHDILEAKIASVEDANIAEKKWIAYYKSNDQNVGYNGTEGGLNYKKSEEHKQKLREARARQPNPCGWKHTEEAKIKMSLAKQGKKSKSPTRSHINKRILAIKINKPGTSKYIGVSWKKISKKWVATIYFNKKQIYIGVFSDEKEAALARDAKSIELFGESALLNFPKDKNV